jgi:RNA polymerase sigma factor (sigma-70 family)
MAVIPAGAGVPCGYEPSAPPPVVDSDIGELYRVLAKQVERIVRVGVRAPDPLIEDACQCAWARLVQHQARVRRETALAWLVKTALHEAIKSVRRGNRELSLDTEIDGQKAIPASDFRPGPSEVFEQRERLSSLSSLPPRQQRLLWLYGLGLTYEEIAARDGCTPRTVERQLKRARTVLRGSDR